MPNTALPELSLNDLDDDDWAIVDSPSSRARAAACTIAKVADPKGPQRAAFRKWKQKTGLLKVVQRWAFRHWRGPSTSPSSKAIRPGVPEEYDFVSGLGAKVFVVLTAVMLVLVATQSDRRHPDESP